MHEQRTTKQTQANKRTNRNEKAEIEGRTENWKKRKADQEDKKRMKIMKELRILQQTRQTRRVTKQWKLEQKKHTEAQRRQGMTFGAWNTRQMGAYSVHTDTWAKTRHLFNLIEKSDCIHRIILPKS